MYRILVPKVKLKVLVTQSCLTLCDPMNCSLPGSSVHGFPQEKMTLEWVVIPFSRGWERKWEKMMKEWNDTGVGCHSLLQGIFPTQGLNLGFLHCRQILYHLTAREAPITNKGEPKTSSGILSWATTTMEVSGANVGRPWKRQIRMWRAGIHERTWIWLLSENVLLTLSGKME